jgi:hypothetical protein
MKNYTSKFERTLQATIELWKDFKKYFEWTVLLTDPLFNIFQI